MIGEYPCLELVHNSEIEATLDFAGICLDGVLRPVLISQDELFLQLTVADARRLLKFLNEAIPYAEEKIV